MKPVILEIPSDVVAEARIPPDECVATLKRELAVQLYARGILPKAAARKLSGLPRVMFDDLLGQRGIPSRLTEEDLDQDLRSLDEWSREAAGHDAER